MTRVRVELNATNTMPRWAEREEADSALVREWDGFVAALRIHEDGHRDLTYAAAREIQQALRRIVSPSCATIPHTARVRGDEILRKYRELQARYDEETRHGAAQNVRWPWQQAEPTGGTAGTIRPVEVPVHTAPGPP